MMNNTEISVEKMRELVANYMQSEGCSCCRDVEAHIRNKKEVEG